MRARAAASSANLGPGFDALAVALDLWVDVVVEEGDRLRVVSTGQGADLRRDASNLAARVAAEVLGHDRVTITVTSDIPVGRGLGSSAALAVATAAAAGSPDPFGVAAAFDGHPENAAASAFGGLVAATKVRGQVVARRLALDPKLRFVVLVPERRLSTAQARQVLPSTVQHSDAAFNLGRMGILMAGLADSSKLIPEATEDRLHQDRRAALFPPARSLLEGLRAAGALASCWSGAGPSLLGICDGASATAVAAAGVKLMEDLDVPGHALVLGAAGGLEVSAA